MDEKLMQRLFALIATVMLLVWAVSFLAPLFVPNYKPAPEINLIMMAVVGLFVDLYRKSRKPKDDEDSNG
jgi:hypothetical protein